MRFRAVAPGLSVTKRDLTFTIFFYFLENLEQERNKSHLCETPHGVMTLNLIANSPRASYAPGLIPLAWSPSLARKPRQRGTRSTPTLSPFTRQIGSLAEQVSATKQRVILQFTALKYGSLDDAKHQAKRVCTTFANYRMMQRRQSDKRQDEKGEPRRMFTPCHDVVCQSNPMANGEGYEVHMFHQDDIADMFDLVVVGEVRRPDAAVEVEAPKPTPIDPTELDDWFGPESMG